MKETAAESAGLKVRLKNHWARFGYWVSLPLELAAEADAFPLEYDEACEEFETQGWALS